MLVIYLYTILIASIGGTGMENNIMDLTTIEFKLKSIEPVLEQLVETKSLDERLSILDQNEDVQKFTNNKVNQELIIKGLDKEELFIIKSLAFLKQTDLLFQAIENQKNPSTSLNNLLVKLKPVERFYDCMGGIIGYQASLLRLLTEKKAADASEQTKTAEEHYLKPPGYDISSETEAVDSYIFAALENLPFTAEIYPVGGAGDRLMLKDESTGEDLPSAELPFQGRTLLEGLIRDLKAKEHLYNQLFGKNLEVPVVMMTSEEKKNYQRILSICERNEWFGRSKESFKFVQQPLVPVVNEEGDWVVTDFSTLSLKPGGHGVIWKLILDAGLFDHLSKKGIKKALVRQINNPISGIDFGMLAFCGIGFFNQQHFGFASCPRLLNTAEGMNVLIEKKVKDVYTYTISNVEYPDFVKKNIPDVPEKPGSSFSKFSANTNILFVDIDALKDSVHLSPVPGQLINMKTKFKCLDAKGSFREVFAGRLESLMQNIADVMVDQSQEPMKNIKADELKTFITYSPRKKTISVTKKMHSTDSSILETPMGAYFDLQSNHHDLFKSCGMQLPDQQTEKDFLANGPSYHFAYHPALGPLYSIIRQKVQGGRLHTLSELILEISDLSLTNVEVKGSLQIIAESPEKLGSGICELKDCVVINQGVDYSGKDHFWKSAQKRNESFQILLKGNSMFVAKNVKFEGNLLIEVPDGYCITATEVNDHIEYQKEKLKSSRKMWTYSFDENKKISLRR
jgi:hypothetical protein